MTTTIKNFLLSPIQFGCRGLLLRAFEARKRRFFQALMFAMIFSSLAWAQEQAALTLDQISKLLKGGVGSARVAQLVEQRGVGFELNDAAVRQLKADGANETVLAAVRKMTLRYADDQRKKRLQETGEQKLMGERKQEEANARRLEEVRQELREREKRKEEEKKLTEAQKRQQDGSQKGKQELASIEEAKGRAQEAANQKPKQGAGATLMAQEDVGKVASLRNIVVTEVGEVSGDVVNGTKNTVRDVQLQIVYSWRWKNESKPGKDDPGTARYYILGQEIPPSQTRSFSYKPSPPLASRDDGRFDITVKVVGFTQVIQQPAP